MTRTWTSRHKVITDTGLCISNEEKRRKVLYSNDLNLTNCIRENILNSVFFSEWSCGLIRHHVTLFMHQEKAYKRVKLPPVIVQTSYFDIPSGLCFWIQLSGFNKHGPGCVRHSASGGPAGRCWGTRTGTSCQQDLGCTVGNLLNNEHSAGTERPACTSERLSRGGRAPSRAFMKESGNSLAAAFI